MNQKFQFLFRLIVSIASLVYVVLNPLLKQGNEPRIHHLLYLTNWSWIFIVLYFITGTWQSFLLRRSRQNKVVDYCWKLLFSIVQPLSIFVTLLFWLLLHDQVTDTSVWLAPRIRSGIEHSINFILCFIDLLFCTKKVEKIFVLAPINFMLIYTTSIILWKY